jgi:hypothetical protein
MKSLWLPVVWMALASLAWAGPAQIEAQATDPVTPDSMGGCSLKCAIQWTVTSMKKGSDKESRVLVLSDNKATTAWRDDTGGVGAKLIFHFPEKIAEEMNGKIPFYGIDLANGDLRSEDTRKATARVKKVRMYYNNKPVYDIVFPDTPRWASVAFDDIMVHSGDSMTLEILEVYPGANSKTLAISEVVLQGAH